MNNLKAIPIATARAAGQKANASRIAIIAVNEDGHFCVTSWGKTRADCRAAAKFAEGRIADLAIEALAGRDATSGIRDVALDPSLGTSPDLRLPIDACRRFYVGHNGGETFMDGDDYDGWALTVELLDEQEADTVRDAIGRIGGKTDGSDRNSTDPA